MSETRSSNFECLRILAIILILIMHSYAQANCKENLFNLFVGYVISAIGNIGVSCFVLLSGYFGVKFKMQRFIQLILITLKSASNLNGNLNCSKELEHYAS